MKSNFWVLLLLFAINSLYSQLTPVVDGDEVGYIDSTGNLVVDFKYSNEIYYKQIIKHNKSFLDFSFDANTYFNEGKATVKIPKKFYFITYGHLFSVIDKEGNLLIEPQENEYGSFSEGMCKYTIFTKTYEYIFDEKVAYMDTTFEIKFETPAKIAGDFHEGLAFILDEESGKYGFIDINGSFKIEPQFDNVTSFSEGKAGFMKSNKWGFINISGNEVIPPIYDMVWEFDNGIARILKNSIYSYINHKGEQIHGKQFEFATDYSDGLAKVLLEDKFAFINEEGKIAFEGKFIDAKSFSEGLAAVMFNQKWGYIDTNGDFVIKPIYDYAESFENGLAKVWKESDTDIRLNPNEKFDQINKNIYYINRKGEVVWEYDD